MKRHVDRSLPDVQKCYCIVYGLDVYWAIFPRYGMIIILCSLLAELPIYVAVGVKYSDWHLSVVIACSWLSVAVL